MLEQQLNEFLQEIVGVPDTPSESAIIGELLFVSEVANEGTPECAVFISADNYTAMDITSMLDSPTNTGAIGFLDPGDWLSYNLNVLQDGTYELDMKVASPLGEGAFKVIDMESWEAWGTAFTLVTLPSGPVSLMI